MKLNNKYYVLRHGEAVSNVKNIVSCWPEKFDNPLTEDGVSKIKRAAEKLKTKNIDLIFTSPLLRTEQTAGIIAEAIEIKPKTDKRLRELGFGVFNGQPLDKFVKFFNSREERLERKVSGGENYMDVMSRAWNFFQEIDKKYKGKNILIISHQVPILLLLGKVRGNSILESMDGMVSANGEKRIIEGQLIELN